MNGGGGGPAGLGRRGLGSGDRRLRREEVLALVLRVQEDLWRAARSASAAGRGGGSRSLAHGDGSAVPPPRGPAEARRAGARVEAGGRGQRADSGAVGVQQDLLDLCAAARLGIL